MWTLSSFITAWITANSEHMDTGPSLYPFMVQGLKRFFSSSWLNCSLVGCSATVGKTIPPSLAYCTGWKQVIGSALFRWGGDTRTQVQGQNQEAMQIQPASSATSILHTVCSVPGPELLHDWSVLAQKTAVSKPWVMWGSASRVFL